MPTSFSSQGSTAGNPQKGLLGNSVAQQARNAAQSLFGGHSQQPAPPQVQHPQAPTTTPATHTVTTGPDGTTTTKQTYPGVMNNSGTNSSTTPTPNPAPATPPSGPQVGTPTQNAQNVLDTSSGDTAGKGAANASALYGILGNNAGLMPFSGSQQGLDQSFANLTRPQSTGNLAGEKGLFDTQNAIFQNAANTSASQAIQNKNIATGGAENVLNASLLSPTGYGQTNTSGLTGVQDAGQFGSGPGAASNAQSVKDYTTKINDINAKAPAADAAFGVLNSYAQGIGSNVPVLSGLAQLYGSTAQGSQAVAGFKAQLQAVRDAWGAIEGGDPNTGIPDNVTPAQLTQIQQQLKTDAHNKTSGYQNEINRLSNQGSSSNSSGGSTGGNAFGNFFG